MAEDGEVRLAPIMATRVLLDYNEQRDEVTLEAQSAAGRGRMRFQTRDFLSFADLVADFARQVQERKSHG